MEVWEPPDELEHITGARYSLQEILAAERRAWAERDAVVFYYNGISPWRRSGHLWQATSVDEVPHSGWWHRTSCNCPLCRRGRA